MLNRRGFFLSREFFPSFCFPLCGTMTRLWVVFWGCSGLGLGSARLGGYTFAKSTPLRYDRIDKVRSCDRRTDVGEVEAEKEKKKQIKNNKIKKKKKRSFSVFAMRAAGFQSPQNREYTLSIKLPPTFRK